MSTWDYSWKTSDGVRHEGVITAATKDEVYTTLKAQGIRPIKVSARIVVKGGIRSLRKRDWMVIAVALALTAVAAAFFASKERPVPSEPAPQPVTAERQPRPSRSGHVQSQVVMVDFRRVRPLPRRQIEGADAMDFGAIFAHPAEAYLAAFAEPGSIRRIPKLTERISSDFFDAFEEDILTATNDTPAMITLKRVVAGLKREAESYLESGKSATELAKWLESRQRMEASYRRELHEKVRSGGISREEANVVLKDAGLKELE